MLSTVKSWWYLMPRGSSIMQKYMLRRATSDDLMCAFSIRLQYW